MAHEPEGQADDISDTSDLPGHRSCRYSCDRKPAVCFDVNGPSCHVTLQYIAEEHVAEVLASLRAEVLKLKKAGHK